MPELETIAAELVSNPTLYAGMTDQQAADEFNIVDKSRNRVTMSGKEVKDAITNADWDSRSVDQQQILLSLLARDDLDPFGIDAHIFTDAMTGAAGTSVADLQAARTETVSTATIIGVGFVTPGAIAHARTF